MTKEVTSTETEPLLDVVDAARLLRYTPRRVRQLSAARVLPGFTLPGSRELRFRPESLRKLIAACEMGSK